MHSACLPCPNGERARDFGPTPASPGLPLDTLEPPPSAALLSVEEAKERLRQIVEGFFFPRLRREDTVLRNLDTSHRGSSEVRGMTDPPGSLQSFRYEGARMNRMLIAVAGLVAFLSEASATWAPPRRTRQRWPQKYQNWLG